METVDVELLPARGENMKRRRKRDKRKCRSRVDGRSSNRGLKYECAQCDFTCYTRTRWYEHQFNTGHSKKGES